VLLSVSGTGLQIGSWRDNKKRTKACRPAQMRLALEQCKLYASHARPIMCECAVMRRWREGRFAYRYLSHSPCGPAARNGPGVPPKPPAQLEISGSSSLIPPSSHFTTTFCTLTGSKHVGMKTCTGSSPKRAGKENFTLPVLNLFCCLHQGVFRKS